MLTDVTGGDRCLPASEAEKTIRARLLDLGHRDWRVVRSAGVDSAGCVAAAADTVRRDIVLMLALSAEVRGALRSLASTLLDECASENTARQRLRGPSRRDFCRQTSHVASPPASRVSPLRIATAVSDDEQEGEAKALW